jgi:electron transfer flavoprotein beta subunit
VNIIVCVKAVPSRPKNPVIMNEGQCIRVESPQWLFNESDEYALEQALLLKKSLRASVTVITAGPVHVQDILYASIARGADSAVRIDVDEFDPNLLAHILFLAIKKQTYDLVLTGVESSDGMSSQVGISLATKLGVPYAYAITKVEAILEQKSLRIERELGGGRHQTLEIELPALLAIQSGITRLSYTPAAKLFQARRTGIPCLKPEALGLSNEELKMHRNIKIIEVFQRTTANKVQLLTGNSAEVAKVIFDQIKGAL